MENVRNRRNLVLIHKSTQQRFQTSKPNFKRFEIFSDDIVGVELSKPVIMLSKPIYIGAAILDLSKVHMYNAYYNILKKELKNVKLLFTGQLC